MSGADVTDLHDATADDTRIETMDTDWDSVASAVADQWQVWAFALLLFGMALFGLFFHEGWYGEVTYGIATVVALYFGYTQVEDELTRH